jgi:hypothetical protein
MTNGKKQTPAIRKYFCISTFLLPVRPAIHKMIPAYALSSADFLQAVLA